MILTFPDNIFPTECIWRLLPNTEVFSNPFNNARQTLEQPGAAWEARLRFDTLTRERGAVLHALVAKLRGAAGRIALWDHASPGPLGAAGGLPVVDGAGQWGNRLNVRGCPLSTPAWLKQGDYFQLGNQLHLLTENANTDASGRTLLIFEAPLRHVPTDGTGLILTRPAAVMMLKDDDQGGRRSSKRLVLSSMSLIFVEDVSL